MAAPILWDLKPSHYAEKARWALDYKSIPHERRAVIPGRHLRIARRLGAGQTFPVLVWDGIVVGDSKAIVATLERRCPDPPLYPVDPEDRRRALELEAFLDEELGEHLRRVVLDRFLRDRDLFMEAIVPELAGAKGESTEERFRKIAPDFASRFSVDERTVAESWQRLRAVGARFRDELQPNGYLVGDDFTVADLTAAALASLAVAPPQFPYPQPQRGHPLLEPIREALAACGLYDWTLEMYARHRGRWTEVATEWTESAP